jgi:hypothetical protein
LLGVDNKLTLKEFNEKIIGSSLAFKKTDENVLPRKWKSITGGQTIMVRQSEDHVYVEYIFPDAVKKAGGFLVGDLKREGLIYMGVIRRAWPCTYKDSWGSTKFNICRGERNYQIRSLTPTRIEGITFWEVGATLDCKTCTFDPPEIKENSFVLIPE